MVHGQLGEGVPVVYVAGKDIKLPITFSSSDKLESKKGISYKKTFERYSSFCEKIGPEDLY